VRTSSVAGLMVVAPSQGYMWAPDALLGKDNFENQE